MAVGASSKTIWAVVSLVRDESRMRGIDENGLRPLRCRVRLMLDMPIPEVRNRFPWIHASDELRRIES